MNFIPLREAASFSANTKISPLRVSAERREFHGCSRRTPLASYQGNPSRRYRFLLFNESILARNKFPPGK